jgi:hypothetical protein
MIHFQLSACAELLAILMLLGFTMQAAEDFISPLQRYADTEVLLRVLKNPIFCPYITCSSNVILQYKI